MAKNYISLKVIMDKILRHPMMAGISYEAVVDYCIDFMRIVACPNIFEEKSKVYSISEYKIGEYDENNIFVSTTLPDDFYEVIQVRTNNEVLRHSTDSFHMSNNKDHMNYSNDLTYKIQGNVLYTSFKEGEIELMYSAIPVDDIGFPMIPDNSKFTRALEAYVKKQWFTILFDMGKLQPQILQNVQQEYAWAVGACETEFNKLTLDKAESFYNSFRGLLLNNNRQHKEGFINLGKGNNRNRRLYTASDIKDLVPSIEDLIDYGKETNSI